MLAAFTAGLLLITISELGDKTFFIAAILAMRHSRRWVFVGSIAALAAMTILSVLLGQAAGLLPSEYVRWAEVLLFTGFGLKLLYDANRMGTKPNLEEQQEAAEVVEHAEAKLKRHNGLAVLSQAFGLTFVAEWGDRTQFTTIALSAANNPYGVTAGAILGHAICAALAVLCGRMVCKRISERTVTALGSGLFLLFGLVSFLRLMGLLS
ncbi:TMEM165/GDT1 family protein [Thermocoleostomius sinensis]|jgi:putative Ca2+/H+ antiporter (TMEM165/GDT1 family)|uniref:GDT1 family protein n=1 Tax=Thermocoleostomius sinensis A174 TaxID=2016057 RepID=A0A9E8ZDM7_9CYAN|nr:TMEM165/GDT1 family protein [Thermocoleostomius sinensis]WAL59984.1 TMEM165/GDT1 family protein [Thermocoleostomius sinensis A174]